MLAATLGGLFRAFPFMVPVCGLGYGLIFHQRLWCYYALVSLTVDVTVYSLKQYFFRPLYHYLGVTHLPILGQGARPDGATNCGWFIDCQDPTGHGYGMPSGHAASACVFATFWALYLWDQPKLTQTQRGFSIAMLVVLALSIAYSRHYFRCHTPQQIIVGGLLGSIIGYLSYHLWRSWEPLPTSS